MNDTSTPTVTEQRAHFRELLTQFSTAMLVTHGGHGELHARPMAVATVEEDCSLWFFASRDSSKTHDIETDTSVLIVCQNDQSAYLSMSGQGKLVNDQSKIDELWKESYKMWFPAGKEDPSIMLIQVQPEKGEFWDNGGINKIQYLFQTAKAYFTGTTPELNEREQHGEVRL